MPHPYCNTTILEASVEGEGNLFTILQDLNLDGTADSEVYAQAQKRADVEIDSRLGQRFAVPFAGDPPADFSSDPPGDLALIATISAHLVLAELAAIYHPDGPDYRLHRGKALGMLDGILAGSLHLEAPLVPADEASTGISHNSREPVFHGRDDEDVDRMAGW